MKHSQVLFVAAVVGFYLADACVSPPLAADYTNQKYLGVWYEVGKVQTAGGASYQEGCICTTSTIYSENLVYGDATVTYQCRMDSPDNTNITSIDSILTAGENPGNFEQRFRPRFPPADYNVIWLDEDSAMEYDCTVKASGIEEYCVHFMSRTTVIEPSKLETMKAYAESLGLNPQNIPYFAVEQEGCW